MAGCLLFPPAAAAQDNFQIQVNGSETVAPGSTLVELFSSAAAQGTTRTENGVLRSQGAFHETLGITQGWTAWLETGFFVLTSVKPDSGWEWAGARVQPRVRAPDGWHLPVGLSLSVQVGYERRAFSADTWTLDIGPTIDTQWGPWYVSFNPTLAVGSPEGGCRPRRGARRPRNSANGGLAAGATNPFPPAAMAVTARPAGADREMSPAVQLGIR